MYTLPSDFNLYVKWVSKIGLNYRDVHGKISIGADSRLKMRTRWNAVLLL